MSSPMISLVTPCRNAEKYLDATIRSVLDQGFRDLEYIVMDGVSSDGTLDIIRKYESRLSAWVSEPDRGPYDALNNGFAKTSGDIMGWLNSDDLHCPWTLQSVADIFASFPDVHWITSRFPLTWDIQGQCRSCYPIPGFDADAFYEGRYIGSRADGFGWIQQESTFWRRSLWEKIGGLVPLKHHLAADFDLWFQFFQHAELCGVDIPLAGFRRHAEQRSRAEAEYVSQCERVIAGAPKTTTACTREQMKRWKVQRIPGLRTALSPSWKYHGRNIATEWSDQSEPRWIIYPVMF